MVDEAKGMLRHVSLEVRYTQGLVYLDRCGSTAIDVENALGAPFKATVPQMIAAEIKNTPERLTVRFGSESFSVQHEMTTTAVRVVDVAGTAWKIVSERLGVGRNVSRVGMRFFHIWATANESRAGQALVRSPTMRLDGWAETRGEPIDAIFTVTSSIDAERKARMAATSVRFETSGDEFSARVMRFFPKFALQVDTDVYSDTISSLGSGQLREFAKAAAAWAKVAATGLGNEILGEPP